MAEALRAYGAALTTDTPIVGADVAALFSVLRAASAAITAAVACADAQQVWAAEGMLSPVAWVAEVGRVTRSKAARVVRDAQVAHQYPAVAQAMVDDEITPEAVTELARLDRHRSQRFARDVDMLVAAARDCHPEDLRAMARHWRTVADDVMTPQERDEPNALDIAQGVGGAWVVHGVFDQVRGAWLANALREGSAPTGVDDARTGSERRADALFTMLTGGKPIQACVDVIVDVDTLVGVARPLDEVRCELRGSETIDRVLLERLACTPEIGRVLLRGKHEVLEMGRRARLATPAQRRAVVARDECCVWPQCRRPAAMCEVHHLVPWQHGGPTDVDNLVLLCGSHHDRTHEGWKLCRDASGEWATAPP
ncbi:MAG: HNH endonuclease [Acidimicrobiia bacterium]